ncbi:MAG: type II secretion system protein [Patescibacteria group bacterium]
MTKDNNHQYTSFTLLELLIVIGILAMLGTVVMVIINPVELYRQVRDTRRISDLETIDKALSLADFEGIFLGASSTVYVSIPDTSSVCANLGLPQLPNGWSYSCKTSANYRNVDSSGWVPVNFTLLSQGSPLSALPIDIVNTTSSGQYYTYVPGGSWELTASLESDKYKGINSLVGKDGGTSFNSYEIGSDLKLTPSQLEEGGNRDTSLIGYWTFDEGSGTTAYNSSGGGNNLNITLTLGSWVSGKINGAFQTPVSSITKTFSTAIGNGKTYIFWFSFPSGTSDFSGTFLCTEDNIDGLKEDNLVHNNYGDYVCSGYGGNKSNSAFNVTDANWYMYAFSKSSNSLLCKNDSCVSLGDATMNIPNIKTMVLNGGCGCGNGIFSSYGVILDDVRIYNRAFSDAEIKAIYDATK